MRVRPSFYEIVLNAGFVVICSCGKDIWYWKVLKEHYDLGHFDYEVRDYTKQEDFVSSL